MKHRRATGFSLPEMLAFTFVMSLVTLGMVSLSMGVMRSADRQGTEAVIVANGRTAVDDLLRDARAAKYLAASRTISGTTFTTNSSSTIVFCAPGYDSVGTLSAVSDYIAYRYDSTTRRLTKSVEPGSGSSRSAANNKVIAKRVQSISAIYRVREQIDCKTSNLFKFVINTTPATTPVAYVNGSLANSSYDAATQTVTIPTAIGGSDVQIFYTVTPSTTSLPFVTGVDLTLTLSAQDGRRVTRTMTLTGSARLRNRRV